MRELELRRILLDVARTADAHQRQAEDLRQVLDQARVTEGISSLMDLDLPFEDALEAAASLVSEAISADFAAVLIWTGQRYVVKVPRMARFFPGEVNSAAASLLDGTSGVLGSLTGTTRPFYLGNYAAHPQAIPALISAGVQQVAYVPLGTDEGRPLLLVMRLKGNVVPEWRAQDQALLEVTGRTVGHALRRQVALEHAQVEARADGLTGTFNRRAFDEDVLQAEVLPAGTHLGIVDVDGLKGVNDGEGHAQGDKLLQVFAQALRAEVGDRGQVYRIGGDEFAVISTEDAETLLEWVDLAVRVARQAVVMPVGASAGVSNWAETGSTELLMSLADGRMYAVKRRRKMGERESI